MPEADPRALPVPSPPPRPRFYRRAAFAVLAAVLGLALLEGLASLGMFLADLALHSTRLVRLSHSQFDATLGWTNTPGAHAADLYGPGLSVTINRRGFRGAEVDDRVAPGHCRAIVSGDSFTFGNGVGDDETWVSQIQAMAPRLEMVNMGQGGYGIDQAYLWYRRDGEGLEHQVHIFAVVLADFQRMQSHRFLGYAKPTLRLAGNEPVADAVPIQKSPPFLPFLIANRKLIDSLRLVQLGTRVIGPPTPERTLSPRDVIRLATQVVLTLDRRSREAGRQFIFVLLPTTSDYRSDDMEALRQGFPRELRARGVAVVDLVPALRSLSPERLTELFIAPGQLRYVGTDWHYTAAGNRFIAEQLLSELRAIPGFAQCAGVPPANASPQP